MASALHILVALVALYPSAVVLKRGPHHPRSEVSHSKRGIDEHISPEHHDIQYDLQQWGLDANVEEMTDEDKQFYYFKVHDTDNNHMLDGLEMLQAALHQKDHSDKKDRDAYVENATEELNHIIDVIDKFILIADINKDGYLYFMEYLDAINGDKLNNDENDENETATGNE